MGCIHQFALSRHREMKIKVATEGQKGGGELAWRRFDWLIRHWGFASSILHGGPLSLPVCECVGSHCSQLSVAVVTRLVHYYTAADIMKEMLSIQKLCAVPTLQLQHSTVLLVCCRLAVDQQDQ